MNFLKKGLAQVSAAVEKAREATAVGGTSGEGAMAGSRSSGALSSAPGAPAGAGAHAARAVRVLPDPSTLPEIRFDPRDPNEAHVAFLWSVLEGAPKNSQAHDDALASFLDGFAAAYGAWTPAPGFADDAPTDAVESQRHAPGGSLTGCATGHPGGVLRALAEATPRRRRELERALDVGASGAAMTGAAADGGFSFGFGGAGVGSFVGGIDDTSSPENETALASAAGLDLFDALRIATRSAHNRAFLFAHGVLDELTLTLQLATRRQNALAAYVGAAISATATTTSFNAAARAEAIARVRVLQRVSARIVDVLREYLEVPEERGETKNRVKKVSGAAPAVKPLLECGALGALVETIRVQRLVRSTVVGAQAEAAARALERAALRAMDGATRDSVAAQNALRASGGLDVLVQSLGDPRSAGLEPGTSESRASMSARIAALRAVRSATRRNGQSARDAAASGAFGEPLAAALAAAAAEDAARFLIVLADGSPFADDADALADRLGGTRVSHDGDPDADAYDPVSRALREADTAPVGVCLAEAFEVLAGFVVASDCFRDAATDDDLESSADQVVSEGLLPAIVRAALACIADPPVAKSGRETRATGAVAFGGAGGAERSAAGKEASAAAEKTNPASSASASAGAGAAPPEGGGGGGGGFVVTTGNPFADSAEGDDAFGGVFGENHGAPANGPAGLAAPFATGGAAAASAAPADPEEVREAANHLLRAHVCSFLGSLLRARPRAVIDALRAADAWRRLLDDDGAFGATGDAPPSPYAGAFGASSRRGAVAGGRARRRRGGRPRGHGEHRDAKSVANARDAATGERARGAGGPGDAGGARRAAGGGGVAGVVAGALRDVAPRATAVALLSVDGPARLGVAAAAQADAWGVHPAAAAAATDASVLEDVQSSSRGGGLFGEGKDAETEWETSRSRVAAQAAVLSLLSSVLEDGGAALGAGALTASPLIDLLFELLWRSETRHLALKSLVALITGPCAQTGGISSGSRASRAADDAWDALIRRFLQTLPAAREVAAGRGASDVTKGQGFGPLSDILAGLRAALAGPGGSALRARLASSAGADGSPAYVQVVSLLNGSSRGVATAEGEAAALECVRTLRSLLSGSETAARAFGRDVGYETFAHALEAAWGAEPVSEALARSVLELAVDADLPTTPDASASGGIPPGAAIRNAGALPVLLTLLRRAALPVRLWGLGALADLLENSVRSRAAADQSDALGFLLDWFAEEATGDARDCPEGTSAETTETRDPDAVLELLSRCIGQCASHSLSARHFRGAFRILRDAGVCADARRRILRALRAAARREGPAAYFDFAGDPSSGNASNAPITHEVRGSATRGNRSFFEDTSSPSTYRRAVADDRGGRAGACVTATNIHRFSWTFASRSTRSALPCSSVLISTPDGPSSAETPVPDAPRIANNATRGSDPSR